MPDAVIPEFPFMATLPKKERMSLFEIMTEAKARWKELREVTKREGPLLPQELCARIAGVSKQRIHALAEEGRLVRVKVGVTVLITESSFETWLESPRLLGHPKKAEKPKGWAAKRWEASKKEAKELLYPGLKKG